MEKFVIFLCTTWTLCRVSLPNPDCVRLLYQTQLDEQDPRAGMTDCYYILTILEEIILWYYKAVDI